MARDLFKRLLRLQTARPIAVLAFALFTLILAGSAAARLTIRTSMAELLPEKKPSVIVAAKIGERLAAASVLTVVAEGKDTKSLERFVDALAPELRKIPPDLVGNVDDGVHAAAAFFDANKLLYAPLADIQEVHDAIVSRYDYEVGKATGAELDLDGAPPPAPITAASIRAKVKARTEELEKRFPDGYYLEPGGHLIAIVIHTGVASGDIARSHELKSRVQEAIARVEPKRFDPSMRVDLGGDFIESLEENEQVKTDLGHVGAFGVALILGVVFCFYLRFRALAAMGLTVGIGLLWTFGVAEIWIGHLNSSTGFLVSIVAGNGINFGIIYMARYLEARRAASVEESVRVAHADTWAATLAAAGSAMVAYGSLMATDCRAFRQFGEIGGSGMILCWIATYLFLPSMLVMSERLLPVRAGGGLADRLRGAYGRPFAALVGRFPRAIAVGSAVVTLASTAIAIHYFSSDPMEYDLGRIRTEAAESRAHELDHRVAAVIGRDQADGVGIVVDRIEQIPLLKKALEDRRAAAPEDRKPFDKVVTLFDFVPADQPAKIALLEEVRDRIERAHRRGLIAASDWAEIAPQIPAAKLAPIGIADLPAQVANAFTEKDGTRGRVAYITPAKGRTLGDARYLLEWADSFRKTALSDRSVVEGSGRSVIFADLILAVIEDAPRTIVISLGLTAIILVIAFRGRRAAWIALGTLLAGLAWMAAFMALRGMKLNFLNFIALPISIGVGADYAVNMVQRHRHEGPSAIRRVVIETGGAVVLCSLTTTLGYVALMLSANQAIRSFGLAAAAGEIACVLAAVLVLPAWLTWAARRRAAATAASDERDVRMRAPRWGVRRWAEKNPPMDVAKNAAKNTAKRGEDVVAMDR